MVWMIYNIKSDDTEFQEVSATIAKIDGDWIIIEEFVWGWHYVEVCISLSFCIFMFVSSMG